jgi:hypothetical protein
MKLLSLFMGLLLYMLPAICQTDTTYLYFNKAWEKCDEDTAFYYGKTYKQDSLWHRQDFWVKSNAMQMDATYLDNDFAKAHGTLRWFRENGTLKSTAVYEQGEHKTSDFFYENGKKQGHIIYIVNGSEQTGWDENGKEIPGYIVEREALFPGGLIGWRSYLERNLNANVAARAGAKVGIYTVTVQFIVDPKGNISNVHATQVPAEYKPCGREAIRIIKNGPNWEPAYQENKPVTYQALQKISWQVSEE